jgi:hypothetical protein
VKKRSDATARGEQGQILVLAALMMTAMLGFLAIVIDVGNAYAQRRLMQNGADAAAMAAARLLANTMQTGTSDAAVAGTISNYLNLNGQGSFVPNAPTSATTGAWYVDGSGARFRAVGSGYSPPPVPVGGSPSVWGVEVVSEKKVDTYFAGVIGFKQLTVRASGAARYAGEASQLAIPPTGARILPLIFSLDTYNQSVSSCGGYGGTQITFSLDITNPFNCGGANGTGGFNWGPIVPSSNPDSVIKDMLDPGSTLPGVSVKIGDPIQTSPGERDVNYWDLLDNWQGQDVIVPLIANTSGCPNCGPPLYAFAWFHVYTADGKGAVKTVTGWWVDPRTKPPTPGRRLGSSSTITGPVTFALTR